MSQTPLVYEAEIYRSQISYRNFAGEVKTVDLEFSLHPLKLMHLISTFEPKKVKSGNPARNGQTEVTEEQQIQFVHNVAKASAGKASEDGESWIPWEGFEDDLVGQAFMTKLSSSDGDRREFAETVLLKPFRAFVNFAVADESNSKKDIESFQKMLRDMEQVFRVPEASELSVEERQALLEAEMDRLQKEKEGLE